MIIVTGGAGMIGSNIVAALNADGHDDIVVVDDLTDGHKIANLADLHIADYLDKEEFLARLEDGGIGRVEAIFHQGACSTTTEWNGKFMMEVNYAYSKRLLHACLALRVPFLYASSASVYGGGSEFREESEFAAQYEQAQRESLTAFGSPDIFVEKFVQRARHIEVQLLGDRHGHLVHLFERDCSVQRRHQKVAEASMNCGRNAMKKMAVLGLSTSTVMLSKKARRADFRSMTGSVAVPWILARSSETPSQIRYSAPTSLTAM